MGTYEGSMMMNVRAQGSATNFFPDGDINGMAIL